MFSGLVAFLLACLQLSAGVQNRGVWRFWYKDCGRDPIPRKVLTEQPGMCIYLYIGLLQVCLCVYNANANQIVAIGLLTCGLLRLFYSVFQYARGDSLKNSEQNLWILG